MARWAGVDPHDRLEVHGTVRRFRSDMLHFSNSSVEHYVLKIPYFCDLHLRHQLATGQKWNLPAVLVRFAWRFVRAYLIKRGFMDGYPGFFLAASTAYAALARHSMLFEHERNPSRRRLAMRLDEIHGVAHPDAGKTDEAQKSPERLQSEGVQKDQQRGN